MSNRLISSWTMFLMVVGAMFWCGETFGGKASMSKPVTDKPGVKPDAGMYYSAWVNFTYKHSNGSVKSLRWNIGRYGRNSKIASESGVLVHVRHGDNLTTGCAPPENIPNEKWVALVQRGSCTFHDKISNVAKKRDAAAVIVYNNGHGKLITMEHEVHDVVSIFIPKIYGQSMAHLVDSGTRVNVTITVGTPHYKPQVKDGSRGIIVSPSIILVFTLSLALCILTTLN